MRSSISVRTFSGLLSGLMATAALCVLAAPETKVANVKAPAVEDFSGELTATGKFTVDGKPAKTGATVHNGSEVASGPDGDGSIDLGALGRVQIRPNTTVKLMLSSNNCQLLMEKCGSLTQSVPPGVTSQIKMAQSKLVDVTVSKGEVWVDHEAKGKTNRKNLKSVSTKSIYGAQEVNANGESTFTVNCCQCCFVIKKHS